MKTPFRLPATKYSPEAQISAALYSEGNGLCLYTTDEHGFRQLTITFNSPKFWRDNPELIHIQRRALLIKGWSENEGVLEAFNKTPELHDSTGGINITDFMPHRSPARIYFMSRALAKIHSQLIAKQNGAAA